MPPANRAGDQFDTLVVVRHKPVLEDSLKPSRLCRVSGRNGGQFMVRKKTVAVSERYGVHIFSLNNWDDLMIWLDRLEQGMSGEHKQALVQAYPKLMARLGS